MKLHTLIVGVLARAVNFQFTGTLGKTSVITLEKQKIQLAKIR
jgi:hypothetical protein